MADDRRISAPDEVAGRIADGAEIDWPADASADPEKRALMDELKVVSAVASLHRRPDDFGTAAPAESRWGRLLLTDKVAEGSFGEVYRAWDPHLGRRMALKLLHERDAQPAPGSEAVEEARQLARVRHPNVLAVFGADRIDGRVGIWTEYIEGQTLDTLLTEQGPVTPAQATAVGLDLCGALGAVHNAGLVHRDVKAQNVMREVGGRIVLMDFGAVSDVQIGAPGLAGTPLYLAPELIIGDAAPGVETDLYSLAVLLFRLLTGRYPVDGGTFDEVRDQLKSGRRTLLSEARRDLPGALTTAIERGLARNPADRFHSADEFASALRASMPLPARDRRRPWAAVAAIGAMVAIAGWLIGASVSDSGDSPRRLCRDCVAGGGSFSHDGRYEVLPDAASGDLIAVDLSTGGTRRLFVKTGDFTSSRNEATLPLLSRSNRQVAYRWWQHALGTWQLRVSDDRPGAESRILLDKIEVIQLLDWSPDDKRVLVEVGRSPRDQATPGTSFDLVWIDIADRTVSNVKSFGSRWRDPVRAARVSNSGRYIALLAEPPGGDLAGPNELSYAQLSVMAVDGGGDHLLDPTATTMGAPVWSADDTHVLYQSGAESTFDLWSVALRDGRPSGSPQKVVRNIGQDFVPVSLASSGVLRYSEVWDPLERWYTIALNGTDSSPSLPVPGRRPSWSPDGTRFAFTRKVNNGLDIAVVVRDAQRERVYPVRGINRNPPIWSRDGASLFVVVDKGDRGKWLTRVSASEGNQHDIAPLQTGSHQYNPATGVLGHDNRTLYLGARRLDLVRFDQIAAIDVVSGQSRTAFAIPWPVQRLPAPGGLALALSPNGRQLAMGLVDKESGRAHVLVAGTDGSAIRELPFTFDALGTFRKIAWTDEGRSILFAARELDARGRIGWRLMKAPAAGGAPVKAGPWIEGDDSDATFDVDRAGTVIFDPGVRSGRPAGYELWQINLSRIPNAIR